MKLHYQLQEKCFIAFQLFFASKSESIRKDKRKKWLEFTSIAAVMSQVFYCLDIKTMASYFGIIAVIGALFYPDYFKWRHKATLH